MRVGKYDTAFLGSKVKFPAESQVPTAGLVRRETTNMPTNIDLKLISASAEGATDPAVKAAAQRTLDTFAEAGRLIRAELSINEQFLLGMLTSGSTFETALLLLHEVAAQRARDAQPISEDACPHNVPCDTVGECRKVSS